MSAIDVLRTVILQGHDAATTVYVPTVGQASIAAAEDQSLADEANAQVINTALYNVFATIYDDLDSYIKNDGTLAGLSPPWTYKGAKKAAITKPQRRVMTTLLKHPRMRPGIVALVGGAQAGQKNYRWTLRLDAYSNWDQALAWLDWNQIDGEYYASVLASCRRT